MRYFLAIFLVCVLAFAATFGGPAYSQKRSGGYCDGAKSTAATLSCVNKSNQDIQAKLSEAFKATLENQDENTRALLNEAQKNWLIYRDAQCKWESEMPESESLKRIYELSCLNQMTKSRISALQTIKEREEQEEPREFGTLPRWMNALLSDHPDVFWRYSQLQTVDLNCDGENEQIVSGIAVADIQDPGTVNDDKASENMHRQVDAVVAISTNPATGRPKAKLFHIPVTAESTEAVHLCKSSFKLSVSERPAPASSAEEKDEKHCKNVLQVIDKVCDPVSITWDGKAYNLGIYDLEGKTL